MTTTLAKLAPRAATANVLGESVPVVCPAWCVVDHSACVFAAEDIAHLGAEVSVPVASADGTVKTLKAKITSWLANEEGPAEAFVAYAESVQAMWAGEVESLNAYQVLTLAREHDSAALRLLGLQLRVEKVRLAARPLLPLGRKAIRWDQFMREICWGCHVA